MLKFTNGTHAVEIDRQGLEATAQGKIGELLSRSNEINPILKSALKGVAEMLLIQVNIKAPKGVDKLEFLTAYIIKLALDALEKEEIPATFTVKEATENVPSQD